MKKQFPAPEQEKPIEPRMALPTDSFAVRLLGRLAHAVYHHRTGFLSADISFRPGVLFIRR
jgi:hypothetical protein